MLCPATELIPACRGLRMAGGVPGQLRSPAPVERSRGQRVSKPEGGKGAGGGKDAKGALAVEQEEFDAITDQIPQRPMGVVEGTSYTLLIAAGIAIAGLHLLAIHPYGLRQTWMQDRSRPPSATHQRR